MTRRKVDPLRPFTSEEQTLLEQISRSRGAGRVRGSRQGAAGHGRGAQLR